MPHLLISAAHKSSGKTTVTLGLCAALHQRGVVVQPFKKGPDYIDPMWLHRAAGRPCHNLDFNTQSEAEIRTTFARAMANSEVGIVEGNMSLYDSVDVTGRHSNAELAKLLAAPVVLVLDVQGVSRGVAPLLMGYQAFDPEVNIAGVILNKVAGGRHERRLRAAVEHYTDLPVLGVVQRNAELAIRERHLGLVPSNEAGAADERIATIAAVMARELDLDALLRLAREGSPALEPVPALPAPPAPDVRIAIARDAAFGFYYDSDLEAFEQAGAKLVPFDALRDTQLPAADGLFIGGGFPETQMEQLAANSALRASIREAIEAGLPTYAECGGLMYLSRSLTWHDQCREMVGVVPGDVVMHERPVGRGHIELQETGDGPWPLTDAAGTPAALSAHEFHYSSLENLPEGGRYAFRVLRGSGLGNGFDGWVHRNLLACYTHQRHVAANPWTSRFVDFVRRCKASAGAP